MLPSEIPTVCGSKIAKKATKSSGKEVEKATNKNPTLVFPKPVTLAKLTELVIVKLLALIRTTKEMKRTRIFPIIPSCSNNFKPLQTKLLKITTYLNNNIKLQCAFIE
jgi:hypothetical protein